MAEKPVFINEVQDKKIVTIKSFQNKPKKAIVEDAIDFYYTHIVANKEAFTKFIQEIIG